MNEAINKEIFKVCTHKYKKECEKAHENVKRAGYTIKKINGRYNVINEKTNKGVRITEPNYFTKIGCIQYDTGRHNAIYKKGERIKFDFKNYLETPKNKEKNINENNKYKKMKYEIQIAKEGIKRQEKYVEKAIEEINKAINKLEYETKILQSYKNRLENARKEIKKL